jgi:hypothetical protein
MYILDVKILHAYDQYIKLKACRCGLKRRGVSVKRASRKPLCSTLKQCYGSGLAFRQSFCMQARLHA